MSTSINQTSEQIWEGTSVHGWLITALLLFISFWDLDLVVHNAPFALDFNFSGFIVLLAVWLNQSRYFRLSDDYLDIDGAFNAADIPLEAITNFSIRHIFIVGHILTIEYQGSTTSQKQRIIFLSHIRNHKEFVADISGKLSSTTVQNIPSNY